MRIRQDGKKIDNRIWARGVGTLRIELTSEEILADLHHPNRAAATRRETR